MSVEIPAEVQADGSDAVLLGQLAGDLEPTAPTPVRRLDRYGEPVLGGERDALFPAATVRATARALKTEAHLIPGTSHMLTIESRWREAAEALLAWLDGFVPAGPNGRSDNPPLHDDRRPG